jgi:hypothetical protein
MLLFSKTLSDNNKFLINYSLSCTISNSATLTECYIRAILLSIIIGKLSHEAIK